jgi:hypothetical protein
MSGFHVLRSRTRPHPSRGRRVPFSCFGLPDTFSSVPSASVPVFMFCAPGLVCGGTEGVGSLFHVLRARTHFRRYRGNRVPFSNLCSRIRFCRCRVCRVPFSCFALPDSFSAVPRGSCPFSMFCAPELVFGRTVGVGSLFHVLSARTRFRRY